MGTSSGSDEPKVEMMKASNINTQAPEKLQSPSFETGRSFVCTEFLVLSSSRATALSSASKRFSTLLAWAERAVL